MPALRHAARAGSALLPAVRRPAHVSERDVLERLRRRPPRSLRRPADPRPPPAAPRGALGRRRRRRDPAWQRSNMLTLIAGVGVLLLAMGVGVLIGRSGASVLSAAAAPQVITVGGAARCGEHGDDADDARTTRDAKTPASAAPPDKAATKAKALASGVGSSPSKPAPPAVLKSLQQRAAGRATSRSPRTCPTSSKPAR